METHLRKLMEEQKAGQVTAPGIGGKGGDLREGKDGHNPMPRQESQWRGRAREKEPQVRVAECPPAFVNQWAHVDPACSPAPSLQPSAEAKTRHAPASE